MFFYPQHFKSYFSLLKHSAFLMYFLTINMCFHFFPSFPSHLCDVASHSNSSCFLLSIQRGNRLDRCSWTRSWCYAWPWHGHTRMNSSCKLSHKNKWNFYQYFLFWVLSKPNCCAMSPALSSESSSNLIFIFSFKFWNYTPVMYPSFIFELIP